MGTVGFSSKIVIVFFCFFWVPYQEENSRRNTIIEAQFKENCLAKKKHALREMKESKISFIYNQDAYNRILEETTDIIKPNPYIDEEIKNLSKDRAKVIYREYKDAERKHRRAKKQYYQILEC